jgi:glycosyltransferase involved in cell wall biosynthesis
MKQRIFISTNFRFSEGGATTERALGLAKSLRAAGYPVEFLSAEKTPAPNKENQSPCEYEGFPCFFMHDLFDRCEPSWRKGLSYLRAGHATEHWLKTQDLSDCRAFISCGGYAGFYLRIARHLKRNNVAYVADCVDWWGMGQMSGVIGVLHALNTEISMRMLYPRAKNVIAISRFFEEYYRQKDCHVIRVPPQVDLENSKWPPLDMQHRDSNTLLLAYAGLPGKKDLLAPILYALAKVQAEGIPVSLRMLGPRWEELEKIPALDPSLLIRLKNHVTCLGRIPPHEVPHLLAECDFSILVRPIAKYSQAGFPTKLVESLAAGIPVITNRTSNISDYITDESDGIFLQGHSVEDIARGLTRTYALGPEKWNKMRYAARKRASQSFDYRNFIKPMKSFVEALRI